MTDESDGPGHGRSGPPTWAPRTWIVAGLVLALLVAAVITGVQVRAAQAQSVRDAEASALTRTQAQERQEELDARLAEREAQRAAEREAAADQAESELAATEALLAEVEAEDAQVDGELLLSLTEQVATLRGLLDPATASELDPAQVGEETASLAAAREQVAEALDRWREEEAARRQAEQETADREAAAQQEAAQQEAAQPEAARAGPAQTAPSASGGAGPDCGGPDSYEPPRGGGFFTSEPTEDGDGSNGRIPRSQMAALSWCVDSRGTAQWLGADAAAALTRMNTAFRAEFGENIAVDLSYRSYADQVAIREHYGSIAARPGTSNHGWGTAFDVWEWQAYSFGSARYVWLVEQGPAYGWIAPDWARQNGSNPEYWHFEYVG